MLQNATTEGVAPMEVATWGSHVKGRELGMASSQCPAKSMTPRDRVLSPAKVQAGRRAQSNLL